MIVVVVNAGSSSLKLAAFDGDGTRVASAGAERIGDRQRPVRMTVNGSDSESAGASSHETALAAILDHLSIDPGDIRAVGHRVVQGGRRYREPVVIDDDVIADLESLIPLDPDHLPQAISGIRAIQLALPGVANIAAFDTAFHRTIPDANRTYPLPREDRDRGIERFGFHGLSCESIVAQLRRVDPESDRKRTLVAHLGNGCSVTAVRNGASLDTTMGLTPTGGLIMGTRSGDLDPGVVLALVDRHGVEDARAILSKQSGMAALAHGMSDMRDLLARLHDDDDAAFAIDVFCGSARKQIAAMVASLGGVDRVVFTGGIGEHAAHIRHRICSDLGWLGIDIDVDANDRQASTISSPTSRVDVRVMHTDEERAIEARVRAVLTEQDFDR